ncbi:DUF2946 family protein [Trinickia caryophylli]|uniref:DUF2946 domain-containing protein n=1 Tax=Trinickia caryophylli TaxID=28094 RepID=A0A1X7H0S4_TRICW|nr:DUF2946 family protein [Trinickia caryophylli]PMS09961.1 DUF2946 domain-containing protein [Trinickia caryophylli]TRX18312.1 DUF2946 domain-containing protein [Trinickia caryophylli]WQE10905.1 DUF2946 family protein [Trinickia caryophylli]SMF77838.1 Protein of unknown function [Trinickia caryophylli]GLU35556.1 hypothetical protein Busp01_53980 [Trinickia caryophylli]
MARFDGPRLQKTGSLLGLLAILLVTLAPVVSQMLAAQAREVVSGHPGATAAAVCTARADATVGGREPGHAAHAALHLGACIYCGLLFHLPVLPGIGRTFAAGDSCAPLAIVRTDERRAPAQRFPAGKPRAPPASFRSFLPAPIARA